MMTTRRNRTRNQRIAEFYDDCWHAWDYHGKYIIHGVFGGFMLGVMACMIVAEIVWGMV